jgi:hypothetical protein
MADRSIEQTYEQAFVRATLSRSLEIDKAMKSLTLELIHNYEQTIPEKVTRPMTIKFVIKCQFQRLLVKWQIQTKRHTRFVLYINVRLDKRIILPEECRQ